MKMVVVMMMMSSEPDCWTAALEPYIPKFTVRSPPRTPSLMSLEETL